MIIPSIDIQDGVVVQLVGGVEKALEAGEPGPIAENFGIAGEIAVIDLDAALSSGNNSQLIQGVLNKARCRVGGGIRSVESAIAWLDRGAEKVILGTMAVPEVLKQLPRERVIVALDARDGEVVVEGWTKGTGTGILERMQELQPYASGFLVTFVEREGRLQGTDLARVGEIVRAAGSSRVTIAGGVTTAEEIRELDRLGADAQVGMALYTGRISLSEAITAPLQSPQEQELKPGVKMGLWPTVVCDEQGQALGLAWSSAESIAEAVRLRKGVYFSRKRGLWIKGEKSGATQELLKIDLDCDRDCLRFTVRQSGSGFCHRNTTTCWGEQSGISALASSITSRKGLPVEGSYVNRLLKDPELLSAKLIEEAAELTEAKSPQEILGETADVIFFSLVKAIAAGVTLSDIDLEFDRRAKRITRRPGDSK